MKHSFIIYVIFLFPFFLGAQNIPKYSPILEASSQEKRMYDLLKSVIFSTEKDSTIIHLFPIYSASDKDNQFAISSFIYAESTEKPNSLKLEGATYSVTLIFPKKEELKYENDRLIGFKSTNNPEKNNISPSPNLIQVFESSHKNKYGSKPLYKKEADSLTFPENYDLNRLLYSKNLSNSRIDTSLYKEKYTTYNFVNSKYIIAKKGDFFGIADSKGNTIIPFEFKSLEAYKHGILAQTEKSAYFMDFNGNILSKKYDDISILNEFSYQLRNLFLVKKDNKQSIINLDFKEILPFYDEIKLLATDDHNYVFIIRNNQKEFLFDPKNGKETSQKYDKLAPLNRLFIMTKSNEKHGLINKEGNVLLETIYDTIHLPKYANSYSTVLFVKKEKKMALFKSKDFVTKFDFETIEDIGTQSLYIVSKNNKYAILRENGDLITPFKFKSKEFLKTEEFQKILEAENNKFNH